MRLKTQFRRFRPPRKSPWRQTSNELIFIERVKKHPHEAAHGGAWKIAYADFVAAIMAFFFLLWLLSSTSQDQKTAISHYFAPQSVSESTSGAGGLLGGRVLDTQGAMTASRSNPRIMLGAPEIQPGTDMEVKSPKEGEEANSGPLEKYEFENTKNEVLGTVQAHNADSRNQVAMGMAPENAAQDAKDVALARAKETSGRDALEGRGGSLGDYPRDTQGLLPDGGAAGQEDKELAEIERKLKASVKKDAELRQYRDNIKVERTVEGLRIQLIDDDKREIFPIGSAELLKHTAKLFKTVAELVKNQPNRIAISGHTDSAPFRGAGGYSNWELSSDRANASRRALMAAGVPENRIARVVDRADAEPMDAAHPEAATNRRVSIVLLREGDPGEPSGDKTAAATTTPPKPQPAATPEPLPSVSAPSQAGATAAKQGAVPAPTVKPAPEPAKRATLPWPEPENLAVPSGLGPDKPSEPKAETKPETAIKAAPKMESDADQSDGEAGLPDTWLRLR
ncbi:MAG: hypothetical protein EXQ99_02920 [Alphaproteobacteria bacterium]|nr:hypothetical protein [Alphaproteobacteria bacterium]